MIQLQLADDVTHAIGCLNQISFENYDKIILSLCVTFEFLVSVVVLVVLVVLVNVLKT